MGVIIKDSFGDVVVAGSYQSIGFPGHEIAKAEACLFRLHQAICVGYSCLIVEGDSLYIITKLRNKTNSSFALGFFIFEVLSLVARCSCYS